MKYKLVRVGYKDLSQEIVCRFKWTLSAIRERYSGAHYLVATIFTTALCHHNGRPGDRTIVVVVTFWLSLAI